MKAIGEACPTATTSRPHSQEVLQFRSLAITEKSGPIRSLARCLKDAVKRILRAQDYRIVYAPKGPIAGFNLIDDLRQIIDCPNPVCFDIGANEGQTIELFEETFKAPRIYSFEPAKDTFAKLKARKFRSQVIPNNFAFGSESGQLTFNNYEDSCLSSFLELEKGADNRFRSVHIKSKEVVEVRTIDSFVQQNQIEKIDLLKIDTQGFDLKVLQGAVETLKSGMIDSVLVELNFVRMYENQSGAHLIVSLLAQHNIHLVDYYEKFRQNHTLAWCSALFTKR
jgi:FkbM family methyltransferase